MAQLRTLTIASLGFAAASVASRAAACSVSACTPTTFFGEFVSFEHYQVPADHAFVRVSWNDVRSHSSERTLLGVRTRDGSSATIELEAGEVVALPDPREGDEWLVRAAYSCGADGARAENEVRVRIDAPVGAGSAPTLVVSESAQAQVMVPGLRGDCSVAIDAAGARVSLALGGRLAPFADALEVNVFVDDASWSEATSIAPYWPRSFHTPPREGDTVVYVACETEEELSRKGAAINNRLSEGTHRVRMEAWLGNTSFVSNEVEVELRCSPERIPPREDGGPNAAEDGGVSTPDRVDYPSLGDDVRPPAEGNGCNAVGGGSNAFYALLALGLLLRRKRK